MPRKPNSAGCGGEMLCVRGVENVEEAFCGVGSVEEAGLTRKLMCA